MKNNGLLNDGAEPGPATRDRNDHLWRQLGKTRDTCLAPREGEEYIAFSDEAKANLIAFADILGFDVILRARRTGFEQRAVISASLLAARSCSALSSGSSERDRVQQDQGARMPVPRSSEDAPSKLRRADPEPLASRSAVRGQLSLRAKCRTWLSFLVGGR